MICIWDWYWLRNKKNIDDVNRCTSDIRNSCYRLTNKVLAYWHTLIWCTTFLTSASKGSYKVVLGLHMEGKNFVWETGCLVSGFSLRRAQGLWLGKVSLFYQKPPRHKDWGGFFVTKYHHFTRATVSDWGNAMLENVSTIPRDQNARFPIIPLPYEVFPFCFCKFCDQHCVYSMLSTKILCTLYFHLISCFKSVCIL